MRVSLVAGGAGFIGSHLCEELLKKEIKVICVDNLLTGDKKNIEHLFQNSDFKFIKQDITQNLDSILNQIFRPKTDLNQRLVGLWPKSITETLDYVFHLASPASPNIKNPRSYMAYPIETLLVNSIGTYNLLELSRQLNCKFLFASTSEVYGDPTVSPQSEDYFGNVNPNGIRSVYDESKRFGEAITMAHVRKYNLDCRIVRIFNTYGPKMQIDDGRVVSNFINQTIKSNPITVYGTGDQTRSFCYISDMVDGLLKAMFTENTKGQVINLGNPDERKISELATIIKGMVNSQSQVMFEKLPLDDPKERKPDIQKAKQLLNWEPKMYLEEGLEKTIEYFKSL